MDPKDIDGLIDRLAHKLRDEGYVPPTVVPLNPEMRTGNWCATVGFDFQSLRAAEKPTYVWVTNTTVHANHIQEYLALWQKHVAPHFKRMIEVGVVTHVRMYQPILGGEHSITFMLHFEGLDKVEEFFRQFRVETSKDAEYKGAAQRINEVVQKRSDFLLLEVG